jgi:uncharacterized hydrophobic protein (TIGR00271 family)
VSQLRPGDPPPRDGQPRRESWPRAWGRAIAEIGSVTPRRRAEVLREIDEGSQPTFVYYVLLGLSELIAGFALIVGSDATLIGANVVAPLMTPIFGVALGLMRADLRLLRRGLLAEFGGAALGVVLCFGLGLMPFMGEPSAALLAQTRPTLIDLFVAALAGFAGVLAMIDERISPALPGVAIATALNPPIAALGLCLALGAYQGAWGAFLLFSANVLAILAVAAVLFLIAGFVTRAEIGSVRGLARRFAAAAIGLVLVAGLLTNYLVRLVQRLRTESAIHAVLDDALSHEPNTALVSLEFNRGDGGVDVLSTVRTPHVMAPESVKRIQDTLSERLGEPVRLFMRCSVTKDVSATGSTNLRPYLSLNGRITEAPLAPEMRLLQQAEQVAREVVATRPDLDLLDIELVRLPSGPVVILTIQSSREPTPADVGRFESMLRQRLGEADLRAVVRRTSSTDLTSKGRILLGAAHFGHASPAEDERRAGVEAAVRAAIEAVPNLFVAAVDAERGDDGWTVRAEVVGARLPTPDEVRAAEQRGAETAGEPVVLSLWARTELQVSRDRYAPLEATRLGVGNDAAAVGKAGDHESGMRKEDSRNEARKEEGGRGSTD